MAASGKKRKKEEDEDEQKEEVEETNLLNRFVYILTDTETTYISKNMTKVCSALWYSHKSSQTLQLHSTLYTPYSNNIQW